MSAKSLLLFLIIKKFERERKEKKEKRKKKRKRKIWNKIKYKIITDKYYKKLKKFKGFFFLKKKKEKLE